MITIGRAVSCIAQHRTAIMYYYHILSWELHLMCCVVKMCTKVTCEKTLNCGLPHQAISCGKQFGY